MSPLPVICPPLSVNVIRYSCAVVLILFMPCILYHFVTCHPSLSLSVTCRCGRYLLSVVIRIRVHFLSSFVIRYPYPDDGGRHPF